MELSEKIYQKIGYGVWGLLGVFVLIVISLFVTGRWHLQGHTLTVQFTNVGSLMEEDPVMSMGKKLGHVESIHYTNRSAKVCLKFYKPIDLPKDSKIRNFTPSFMGERRIRITLGQSKERMNPSDLQFGIFDPGVGEQLSETIELVDVLEKHQENIHLLLYGSDSTQPFIQIYQNALYPIWKQHSLFTQKLAQMQTDLQHQIRALSKTLLYITQKTQFLAQQAPTTLKKMQEVLYQVQNAHHSTLVQNLTQPNGHTNQLAAIHQKLQVISHLINSDFAFQEMKYNVHILGKNPSKQKN